jgi:hypothetical protein
MRFTDRSDEWREVRMTSHETGSVPARSVVVSLAARGELV